VAVTLAAAIAVGLAVTRGHRAPKPATSVEAPSAPGTDAIVVGSGIAGLSAAYELAKGGANVTIVDMASVFGGHAVMATGDLCLVATPYQEAQGIHDSADLAYQDFVKWGEDPNPEWARYYVDHSREEIYDWVTSLGVSFETLVSPAGNSVRRTHRTKGRGIGLVTPIFRECARRRNIRFVYNTRLDRLLTSGARVVGIAATNVRTEESTELRADAVVLATGGFQSNLEMVREAWPKDVPFPERFLVGSGMNSMGSGHNVAREAGAALVNLDHQWNYITGLPDPRFPDGKRGLNAQNKSSIWVNADGKRFVAEQISAKLGFPVVTRQKGSTYWSIFDEDAKRSFWIAGSDWGSFDAIESQIFSRHDLVKSAQTIEELASQAGLPVLNLRATIEAYNRMVALGSDTEFARFGPGKSAPPSKIARPPFYAVQFFPLTRKSMGGVAIDTSCRVVDTEHHVIAGLFAAGEVTGLAGINGKAALEGTFLGPSIVTGRVAGRAALASLAHGEPPAPEPINPPDFDAATAQSTVQTCMACHQLPTLVGKARSGYWHFEKVHGVVLARRYDCMLCHGELGPTYQPSRHRIDRLAQSYTCPRCHSGEDR
jgi:flavocytochrome c